jgi:hexokinase
MGDSPRHFCCYPARNGVNVERERLLLTLDFGGTKLTAGLVTPSR